MKRKNNPLSHKNSLFRIIRQQQAVKFTHIRFPLLCGGMDREIPRMYAGRHNKPARNRLLMAGGSSGILFRWAESRACHSSRTQRISMPSAL